MDSGTRLMLHLKCLAIVLLVWVTAARACIATAAADAQALVIHGCYLDRQGFYQAAIADFDRAIALGDRDAYYNRAVTFANVGELEKALHDVERVVFIYPQNPAPRRLRALLLTRLGRWNGAIRDYSVLIAAGDKEIDDYARRAALFGHVGDNWHSKADWRKVVQLDPKYATGHLGKYKRYFADDLASCERTCQFIGPGNWSKLDKEIIAEVFCKVQLRVPGLVERATNGQKLSFVFDTNPNRTGMDSESGFHRIFVHPDCISWPPEQLEWTLVHELVHQVDVSDYISSSKEFCSSAMPLVMRCRNSRRKINWRSAYRWAGSQGLQSKAVSCGLPTFYAAIEQCETLADCTAAMVLSHWHAPQALEGIITRRILAPLNGTEQEAAWLCEAAVQRYEKKNLKQAIAIYTQVLRIDSSCVPALVGLAACWNLCGEQEIALDYTKKVHFILQSDKMPSDFPIVIETRNFLRLLDR